MKRSLFVIVLSFFVSIYSWGQLRLTPEQEALMAKFRFGSPTSKSMPPKSKKTFEAALSLTYEKPCYRRRASKSIQIDKIEITAFYTIVSGRYKNYFDSAGWCNISRDAVIYDCCTGKRHKIIRSEGMLMSPEKNHFSSKYEVLNFKLYFEPIPLKTDLIDLLEYENYDDGFNVYHIRLDGTQRSSSFVDFEQEDKNYFTVVEVEPEFPGGVNALMNFISSNLRYPSAAAEMGIQGRVTLSFVVEKDGSVSDIQEMRSPSMDLTEEAKRVVQSMPKWKPGLQKGKPVRVKYMLPITFRLN